MQRSFTDQLGREVTINFPPERIVSVVPSLTELLFDLGLDEEVVGVTRFCIHPIEKFATRTKIGGTKKLKIDQIRTLQPDLIIANREENTQQEIELLMQEFPVWVSDIGNLEEAMEAIAQIGALVNREPEAGYLNHLIHSGFTDLQTLAAQNGINKKVAYLIWKDPYLFAGKNTFIDHLLTLNGLSNVMQQNRYPEATLSELVFLKPDLVLLSSEPYPFKQQHLEELKAILPDTKVMLVDGEMFSWYGSRMVKAVQYLFEFQKKYR